MSCNSLKIFVFLCLSIWVHTCIFYKFVDESNYMNEIFDKWKANQNKIVIPTYIYALFTHSSKCSYVGVGVAGMQSLLLSFTAVNKNEKWMQEFNFSVQFWVKCDLNCVTSIKLVNHPLYCECGSKILAFDECEHSFASTCFVILLYIHR